MMMCSIFTLGWPEQSWFWVIMIVAVFTLQQSWLINYEWCYFHSMLTGTKMACKLWPVQYSLWDGHCKDGFGYDLYKLHPKAKLLCMTCAIFAPEQRWLIWPANTQPAVQQVPKHHHWCAEAWRQAVQLGGWPPPPQTDCSYGGTQWPLQWQNTPVQVTWL